MIMSDRKSEKTQTASKGKGKGKQNRDIIPAPTVTEKGQVVPEKIPDQNNNVPAKDGKADGQKSKTVEDREKPRDKDPLTFVSWHKRLRSR